MAAIRIAQSFDPVSVPLITDRELLSHDKFIAVGDVCYNDLIYDLLGNPSPRCDPDFLELDKGYIFLVEDSQIVVTGELAVAVLDAGEIIQNYREYNSSLSSTEMTSVVIGNGTIVEIKKF